MSDSFITGGRQSAPSSQDELVKDTTTRTFRADVLEPSRTVPVLVDFWAPWCGPCRQLGPVIEKAVRQAGGKVRLVKMNIDEHPEIAGQLGIQSIPAVIAFKNGQPLDGFMGALPESQVLAFIERVAGPIGPSAAEQALEAAEAAFAEKDYAGAANLYGAVLQEEPENAKAVAGLARCEIALGGVEQARAILDSLPPELAKDAAVAGARAALELAEQASELGSPAELRARIERHPHDHQSRFDLALALNSRGDRLGAVEQLLEIIRRDREWSEDGARKQLVQFFEAWGPKDPATIRGRQRLSSLLFA
ncbi:thioredoxin [Propylenella binzhouense]|uniref:Thioredoxin n=1 Tax=Propylenella binzhouense TaxID=2555902 RepID=A0A964WTD0_9HYPH|nr:thioredoxin [Propylenella binzhouense]MYZ47868.1 thioredoxin [Propylenella binzhouense]